MPLDGPTDAAQALDWEVRQKHASFYQTMVGSVQQAAMTSLTFSTIILTVGLALMKLSGLADGQDKAVLAIAILAWGLLSTVLSVSFSAAALRIEKAYHAEHAELFPGSAPCRLESFLLSFAEKNPRLVRRLTR